jgi:ElaB/YqjD/DUF883 family membrane-anchored ribosome-binding protein
MPISSNAFPRTSPMLAVCASRIAALAIVAIGCTSCGDDHPPTAAAPAQTANVTITPAQDTATFPYAQKDEFTAAMKTQLDKFNADIAELSAKIEKASDAAKADAKPKLAALRAQAAKLGDMLSKAQVATASSWDSVKADFKTGFSDLETGITDARKWLSEKVAP